MAKQKDGITDLTKVLISAAKKFSDQRVFKITICSICNFPWCQFWLRYYGPTILK